MPRIVVAGLAGRLPLGMAPLALLLLVRDAGNGYAAAGAVAAGYSLAQAFGTPVIGRLIDRFGQPRVLLPLAALYPVALAGVVLLARAGAPVAVLAAASVLAGFVLPPLAACIRALWPSLLRSPDLRDTVYALEATLQELFFVAGPLLVALLVVVVSPAAAVLATAAAASLGTLAFATAPAARGARGAAGPVAVGIGALAAPGVVTVVLAGVAMGALFGALEVGAPAFAEERGPRAAGGVVLAAVSFGSLAGGLWAGARPAADPVRRYLAALTVLALATPLLVLADSVLALALLGVLAGLPIAPAFGAAYGLIDDLAPPGTRTEAFAWVSTSVVLGVACGTTLGGIGIEATDARAALVLAAAGGVLAFAGVALRRGTLRPVAAAV